MGDHILVIGATLLDTKGKPLAGLEPGTSNPAVIKHTRGGTARNISENLARMGAEVILISAIGDDLTGRRLISTTEEAGVKMDHVQTIPHAHTGAYIAFLDEDGGLSVAMDDVRVMEHITPKYLYQNRQLFRSAEMVIVDGSLTVESWEIVARLTKQYRVPLCADPSSTRLAYKLRPYLSQLYLTVPNEIEAATILEMDFFGENTDLSLDLARHLNRAGVQHAVIILSDFGLVYATSQETGYIPSRYTEIVDSTGAGDAITAAIVFGMINQLPAIESIRLGAAAGSLTLQTSETVLPNLSLDMLYDHLIV